MTSTRYFVSPADIQHSIVRSARPQVGAYAFFRITDAQKFRDFVRSRGGAAPAGAPSPAVADAASLLDVLRSPGVRILPERTSEKPQVGVTLAFTWAGLRELKVDPVTLETFPEAFKEGMAARAHLLGDFADSAPSLWHGWLGH
ncbi:MAG TPA: hypothetical protein VGF29_09795, partial [Hyphomicrobiaceae bacterium]